MAKKRLFFVGFIITLILLFSILLSNFFLTEMREDAVVDRMSDMMRSYEEMQTLVLMSEFFGEESTCIALESMLSSMNEELWELGIKIDQYRQVTEEFSQSPFYYEQKKHFNQRAVLYYSMLKRMQEMCEVEQVLMTFFYEKKEDCPDCDPQSFVLTDIRMDLEKLDMGTHLALFSFDVDLDLATINLLLSHYDVDEFPCVVINDNAFCGLRDKEEMKDLICEESDGTLCY
ncbi:MAG: hypothetical protein ACOCUR_01590 [Nanoarchaeota archaeon]